MPAFPHPRPASKWTEAQRYCCALHFPRFSHIRHPRRQIDYKHGGKWPHCVIWRAASALAAELAAQVAALPARGGSIGGTARAMNTITDPFVGTKIGRYQIESVLGRGRGAAVYRPSIGRQPPGGDRGPRSGRGQESPTGRGLPARHQYPGRDAPSAGHPAESTRWRNMPGQPISCAC